MSKNGWGEFEKKDLSTVCWKARPDHAWSQPFITLESEVSQLQSRVAALERKLEEILRQQKLPPPPEEGWEDVMN